MTAPKATDRPFVVCRHAAVSHSIWYPDFRYVGLLRELGVEVHVVTFGESSRGEVDGVPVWREPSLLSMARRIRRLRPGVLFLESPCPELVFVPLAARSWVRAPHPARHQARYRLQRVLLRRASRVSFLTPHQATLWNIRPDQEVELFAAVDVDFWSTPIERQRGFWEGGGLPVPQGPVICCVANLVRLKRQVELLRALVPLLQSRTDVTLVFAGRTYDDGVEADLRGLIAEEALDRQVWLAGALSHEDLRQLYAWSDIHVLNSETEMMCMSMWESMSAGVPTLIPDIPQLTLLFPELPAHGDGRQLAANVAKLLTDPNLGRKLIDRHRDQLWRADVHRHDETFLREWRQLTAAS